MTRVGTRLLLASALALPATSGCAGRGATPAAQGTLDQRGRMRALAGRVESWRQAYELRALDGLAHLWSQDEDATLVWQGSASRGWSAIAQRLAEYFGRTRSAELQLTDAATAFVGDGGAIVTGALRRRHGDGVTEFEEQGTVTLVFRRAGTSWLLASEHYSYRPAGSQGP